MYYNQVTVSQSPLDPEAVVNELRDMCALVHRLFESEETGLVPGRVSGTEKRLRPVKRVLEYLNVV